MSDDHSSKRRRRKASPPQEIRDLIDRSVTAALAAEPGSTTAVAAAQEALFHFMNELARALPPELRGLPNDALPERQAWVKALQFLVGARVAPHLEGLSIALQELDRGVSAPSLLPRAGGMRGGLADTDELRLRSMAVEAADELRKRCRSSEEYRAELRESETQDSTIEKYRKSVLAGPAEIHPRSSYTLHYLDYPPEILLQQVVWEIRKLRKKPRKLRDAATS